MIWRNWLDDQSASQVSSDGFSDDRQVTHIGKKLETGHTHSEAIIDRPYAKLRIEKHQIKRDHTLGSNHTNTGHAHKIRDIITQSHLGH